MKKIMHIISIIVLILPSLPLHAVKDENKGTKLIKMNGEKPDGEKIALLENGQPNNPTADEIQQRKIRAQRIRYCIITPIVAAITFSWSLLLISLLSTQSNNPEPTPAPTPTPNPCANVCWYLREFPSLPQGGYFYYQAGHLVFRNCTTELTTTLLPTTMPTSLTNNTSTSPLPTTTMTITNATNATTTHYYTGEVGFTGMFDGYAVCDNVYAPTPMPTTSIMLNATTVKQIIEATGGTVDEGDDIPELVAINQDEN